MVGKESAQRVYCAGGLQVTNLEAVENFAKLGCDRNFLEPTCEAVTEGFSNSRCVDMKILKKWKRTE